MSTAAVTPTVTEKVPERIFLSRNRAAWLIDCSTRSIDDAIRSGELASFRLGRKVLIRRQDLIQFVEGPTS